MLNVVLIVFKEYSTELRRYNDVKRYSGIFIVNFQYLVGWASVRLFWNFYVLVTEPFDKNRYEKET